MDMNKAQIGKCMEKLKVSRQNAQKSHDMDQFVDNIVAAVNGVICFDAADVILGIGTDSKVTAGRFYNCDGLESVYPYLTYGSVFLTARNTFVFRIRDLGCSDLSLEDGRDILRKQGFRDALRGFFFLNGTHIGTIDLYRYAENAVTQSDVRKLRELKQELVRCFCFLYDHRHELGSNAARARQMQKAYHLTNRLTEVLIGLLHNWEKSYIGHLLGIGESTVEKYISDLYKTIGVKSRSELLIKAGNPESWPKIPGDEDPEK